MTMTTRRSRVLAAVVVVVGLLAVACSTSDPPETLQIAGVAMTEPEFLFGMDVDPDPSVTLAPDVVLIPNGSRAARDVTGDGLTWTLDPKAGGVDQLEVGRVMFLTSRGVGRIIGLEEQDGGLAVTIVPVDITEVIHEGEFGSDDLVLDIEQMITYDTGEQPWTVTDLPPSEDPEAIDDDTGEAGGSGAPVAGFFGPRGVLVVADAEDTEDAQGTDPGTDAEPQVQRIAPPRPNWGGAKEVSVSGYRITPVCCAGGVGARAVYDQGGLRLIATVQLIGQQPRASWFLSISGGRITRAEFQVYGGAGLRYDIQAGSETGLASNVHHRLILPGTLSFPAVAAGVPFAFTVRQELLVNTAFSAKNSTLNASGVWSFQGGFGFGLRDGRFGLHQPEAFGVRQSMLDSINGASVGANGLVIGHRVELKVGIGWETFNVGPYAEMVSSIGIVRGSDLGAPLVVCRMAHLNMWLGYGVSYRIPAVIVEVINFVTRIFGASPIAAEGSIIGNRHHIIQRTGYAPQARICQPS